MTRRGWLIMSLICATSSATALRAASISASQAVAAALVYRVVSFVLVAVVGWVVFLALFRSHRLEDARAEFERESERTTAGE